ncbi:lipopolysaccharide biosynthesis protein [Aliivibrio fischeri]|uniref:lipopolysaccharide biosynthesis protein n=1 Tax=Aliivibrio fischeri TaxID=668 RepID=UPI0012DAF0B1|nr:hypothetical protein [Aliivibrio fischeri]MUJ37287.1 hypothetical protein [Aliivibrio fischeri]
MLNFNIIFNFFLSKLIPAISFFLLLQQLYYHLNTSQFEIYSMVFSYSIMISSLISGWICQSNLRFNTSRSKSNINLNSIIINILSLSLFLSVLIYFFLGNDNVISIALALSVAINRIVITYFQSILLSAKVLLIESVRSILIIIYSLYLMIGDADVISMWEPILILVAANFVPSLIVYCFYVSINKLNFVSIYNFKINILKYVRYGIPMSVWLIISTSYPYAEKKLLISLSSVEIADYFALSDFINRGAGMIFIPLLMFMHPKLMHKYEDGKHVFFPFLYKSVALFVFIGLVGCLTIYFISPYILGYIFNGMNLDVIEAAFLIFLIPVLWQLSFLSHKFLEARGRTVILACLILFCMSLSCIMMYFFIPIYGFYGSVSSQVIALTLYILLSLFLSKKESNEYCSSC